MSSRAHPATLCAGDGEDGGKCWHFFHPDEEPTENVDQFKFPSVRESGTATDNANIEIAASTSGPTPASPAITRKGTEARPNYHSDPKYRPKWLDLGAIPVVLPHRLPEQMLPSTMEKIVQRAAAHCYGPCVYGYIYSTWNSPVELRRQLILRFPELSPMCRDVARYQIGDGQPTLECLYLYSYDCITLREQIQTLHATLMSRPHYKYSPFAWYNLGCRGDPQQSTSRMIRQNLYGKALSAHSPDVFKGSKREISPCKKRIANQPMPMPTSPILDSPSIPNGEGFFFVIGPQKVTLGHLASVVCKTPLARTAQAQVTEFANGLMSPGIKQNILAEGYQSCFDGEEDKHDFQKFVKRFVSDVKNSSTSRS